MNNKDQSRTRNFPVPLPLSVFEALDKSTQGAYIASVSLLKFGFDIFETTICLVDVFKFHAKGDTSWSYQIGQGIFEVLDNGIRIEVPVRKGYKYDLSWPELVRLSEVNSVYNWDELVKAVENGNSIVKQYKLRCRRTNGRIGSETAGLIWDFEAPFWFRPNGLKRYTPKNF